jgi:hypothetical protein
MPSMNVDEKLIEAIVVAKRPNKGSQPPAEARGEILVPTAASEAIGPALKFGKPERHS